MTWISEWEGSISWALGGAFAIVFLANLLHWIKNMRRKGIPQISGIVVDANGLAERGIVMEGAAHIEDVAVINARETGILLHGAADAIATNSYVEGNGETIGFDVAGSPNANLSGSVSRNNKVGFRVRNSDSLDLSNSRAEQDEPRPREGRARKSYPVRLPENMKKK